MQTITPVNPTPTDTWPTASAALKRLGESAQRMTTRLAALPAASKDGLEALQSLDTEQREPQIASLLQRIDAYWNALDDSNQSLSERIAADLRQDLHDELCVKIHERDLDTGYADWLPASPDQSAPALTPFSLHVQLAENERAEVAGALILSQDQQRTLLILPGLGITGFRSHSELRASLAEWLNDPTLRDTLLNNVAQQDQDRFSTIIADPDLYLEPFSADDLQLVALSGAPLAYAISRQLHKQRDDIRHACTRPVGNDRQLRLTLIQQAIEMRGLLGPMAMLQLRELAVVERRYRKSLPDWIKFAGHDDLRTYTERLQACELARSAVISALGAAASPEQFAEAHLRHRMANDLGFVLNPHALTVQTRRTLPSSGETYTVTRSLVESALYGLHPGDLDDGSAFFERTTLHFDGAPLQADHASLTPTYLGRLIDELNLRAVFGDYQRTAYQQPHNRQLMQVLVRAQITALAWAAKMQGHIQVSDFDIVEKLGATDPNTSDARVRVQQIRFDRHLPGKLLVFRKETASGQLDRLVLLAMDTPTGQSLKAFDNEKQLRQELIGWSASDAQCTYLLEQLEVSTRPALQRQLEVLRLKPYPPADFVQLNDLADFDSGLRGFINEQVRVALSEQAQHTPGWYLRATAAQRQELLALEDGIAGALRNYEARSDTRVQPFREYVHQRASEQIARLLGVPPGTVDPDHIVITSARETISYTDMLQNGYDNGIDLTRPTADLQATFSGPPGVDLSALTPMGVAGSVRGKWVADDYIAHIRRTLLNVEGEGYAWRRQASVLITRLQMSAAALRSLLKGHIDAQHYAWLKNSIDNAHLNDPSTRETYPLYPLQVHVDKPFIASRLAGIDDLVIPSTQLTHVETVQGCIVVLPTQIRQSALLYTPQAPDGVEFRLFSDFVRSLDTAGMIDYYKDRCRSKARRILSFFLRDMQQGNASKPPFIPKAFIEDFADTCFNQPLERRLLDVEETTTGRNDMLSGLIWTSVEIIATVVTLPFPPVSFAVGAVLSLYDTVRAVQSLTKGDTESAGAYVLSSLLNGLGAAGDLHSGLKGFGSTLRQTRQRTVLTSALSPAPGRSSLPRYSDLFPARLDDETFLLGKPNANGHAPVFRAVSPDSQAVSTTGQFASQQTGGTWRPLAQSTDPVSGTSLNVPEQWALNRSLSDIPRVENGHAKGVCLVDGRHCIELSGKTWQVQYDAQLRCWQIIDPANPFAFFGKKPVGLNEQGQWQLIERPRLQGGGLGDRSRYELLPEDNAGTEAATISDYELPANLRPRMDVILSNESFDPTGMGMEAYFEVYLTEMRRTFVDLREKLYKDANAFFVTAPLPPRPQLPALSSPAAVDTLIEQIFSRSNGLVLSEAPKSVASKRLLILNMPLLAEQRVEVLYIEHLLTDKHLQKLARYRQLGKRSRSGSHELKHYLSDVNDGALNNACVDYDYYHLIKAAHRYGIEVRPFSSSISYPFNAYPVAPAANDPSGTLKMSNFFGHTLISGDVAAAPEKRWIALLDQKLATRHDELPGIAELEGAISVHVRDIPAGRPTRVMKGTGGLSAGESAARADFTISLSNPSLIVPELELPASTLMDDALIGELGHASVIADGERWAGDYGFVRDDVDKWLRVEPEDWSANGPMNAIQQSLADATYDMPPQTRSSVHQLANFEHKGLDTRYLLGDDALNRIRQEFATLRQRLQTDALAVRSASLPQRPVLPAVAPEISGAELLETLYSHTDGVVIGESHFSISSKKLIIDNLQLLSRQNVKTLYMEHLLTDIHQADLDRFFETGQMSKTLLHDLKRLDRGHRTDPDKVYTFERLVIKAREEGLEVRAIDCAVSYHLKGIERETSTMRQEMMNYFASRTISKHQDVMGSHKWIALVGNSHSNTFRDVVPGLAELQGGIGLRIVDVAPGLSRGVMPDPGEPVLMGMNSKQILLKGDYRVEMEVAISPKAIRPPQPLPIEQQLARPGLFMVEQSEGNLQTIVHRSRDRQIHRTPVLINAEGKLYVERTTWSSVHEVAFDNMDDLVEALEELNLTRVG